MTAEGTTNFLWDGVHLLAELDEDGEPLAQYVTRPDGWGGLISQQRGDQVRFYHHDGSGNVRALVDEQGAVTDWYAHSAFGQRISARGATTNRFGFGGEQGYQDEGGDRAYVRARYYSAEHGRWLSADPLDPMGPGRFQYVGNSPVNETDPSGLMTEAEQAALYNSWLRLLRARGANAGTLAGVQAGLNALSPRPSMHTGGHSAAGRAHQQKRSTTAAKPVDRSKLMMLGPPQGPPSDLPPVTSPQSASPLDLDAAVTRHVQGAVADAQRWWRGERLGVKAFFVESGTSGDWVLYVSPELMVPATMATALGASKVLLPIAQVTPMGAAMGDVAFDQASAALYRRLEAWPRHELGDGNYERSAFGGSFATNVLLLLVRAPGTHPAQGGPGAPIPPGPGRPGLVEEVPGLPHYAIVAFDARIVGALPAEAEEQFNLAAYRLLNAMEKHPELRKTLESPDVLGSGAYSTMRPNPTGRLARYPPRA